MMDNTCVCCGRWMPEGGHVCSRCAETADYRELYAKAAKERDEARAALAKEKEVQRERGAFWQRIERAAAAYAKSDGRTEAGDELFEAVYRIRPSQHHDNDLPIEVKRRRR